MASVETPLVAREKGAGRYAIREGERGPRVSHAILLTASQVARRVMRVVFALCVARALGPGGFGTYALLLAVVELVAMISGSGYVDYLTRETAKDQRMGWGLGVQLFLLRCTYVIPGAGGAIAILWLLNYPRPVLAGGAGMLLTLFPRALSESVQGVLRGSELYGSFLAIELTLGLTLVGGSFVLFLRPTAGLSTVIATEIVAAGAAAVVALTLLLRSQAFRQATIVEAATRPAPPYSVKNLAGS